MSRHIEIKELKNRLEDLKKEMRSAGNYEHHEEVREMYNRIKKKYFHIAKKERSLRKTYSSRHPHKYPRRSVYRKL